jgi:GNAT superfamily N-acetyltransferase
MQPAATYDDTGCTRYVVDTDLSRIDLTLVHHWLSTDTAWSRGRSLEVVERAAAASVSFAAFAPDGSQVGYARLVTDSATFGWLCDVYVDRAHRGRRLGVLLASAVADHARGLGLSQVMLSTREAHGVYERVGFVSTPHPERLMVLDGSSPPADG